MSDDKLPRRFGPYLLFDQIGEGGMARLYLGKNTTSLGGERLVVVKQVLPMLADSDEFCRLLTQEAKLAAQLSHRNIAQVVDLGRENDVLYIAMEYVEGFDLRDLLRECSKKRLPLPVQYALLIVLETLRGLDYAHKKQDETGNRLGIVHRDVSPSNVLISFDGDVKLCDFGIALAFGAKADVPTAGIQGKAGYMSPEAAAGHRIDERSDVFALGIILWELLNGRRLYRGENRQPPSLEIAAQANIPPLKLRGYPHEERLHAIVMRALQKEPEQRYGSAAEMRSDLERYTRESSLFASPIKFGKWLTEHFAEEILQRRRDRERSAKAVAAEVTPQASSDASNAKPVSVPPGPPAGGSVNTEPANPEPMPAEDRRIDGSAETGNAEPGNAEPGNAEPGNAEPGNAEAGNAEAGNAETGNAEAGNAEAAATAGPPAAGHLVRGSPRTEPMLSETPPPVTTHVNVPRKAVEVTRSEQEPRVLVASGELGALSSRPPKALWAAAALLIMIVLIVLLTL